MTNKWLQQLENPGHLIRVSCRLFQGFRSNRSYDCDPGLCCLKAGNLNSWLSKNLSSNFFSKESFTSFIEYCSDYL